jgi:hypothetical protein
MKYYRKRMYLGLVTISLFSFLEGFNRSLFYRVSSFWEEPRFEKKFLSTLDVSLLGGATRCGRDGCGKKTNIFSIYGPAHLACTSGSHTKVKGTFDVFEVDFNFYQNLCSGLFWHFHLPVVLAHISSCLYEKKHSHTKDISLWRRMIQTVEPFLDHCNVGIRSLKKTGFSDSSLLLGWTTSTDTFSYLDFVDITLQAGFLIPTGKKKRSDRIFDIPYGYNGHWGFSFIGDIAWGVCDWFTMGLHGDVIAFGKRNECNFIQKLADNKPSTVYKEHVRVSAGPVWRLGWYAKADHFCGPASLVLAFAYEQKNKDRLQFNTQMLSGGVRRIIGPHKEWSRWIVHLLAEYDFTRENSFLGPRVRIFYNREITGKRVFSTHTVGGFIGLDVIWRF